ncbi:MAG: pyrroloquinoline quinone biosynthesis protein PqqE [Planctomycetota bacterium]|nr:pyrroloquinoline quinone biosynthesis protein PqqE [Planctomycetota bacterium]
MDSSVTPPVTDAPYCLIAELTYRCPLRCPYCSNPLELHALKHELTTSDWQRLLREAAALGVVQVHFTGGEPLVRSDLCDLIRTAREAGIYSHLITAGVNLSQDRLAQLQKSGLDAIQISLQDSQPTSNDWLAGLASFEKKQESFLVAKQHGFPVTLNVVVHRHNIERISEMIALAVEWQADRVEIAHVQYVGWAHHNYQALLPSVSQLRQAEAAVATARAKLPSRIELLHVLPDHYQDVPKACMSGWGRVYLTINPDGTILPCQSARCIPGMEFPNAGHDSLLDAWHSAAFRRFRGTDWMPEPCRSCDRQRVDFGGCRCQAFLVTGDPLATDPVCQLSPDRPLIEAAVARANREPRPVTFRSMTL